MSATTPREGDTLPAVAGQTQAGWSPYVLLDPEADPFAVLARRVAEEEARAARRQAGRDRMMDLEEAGRARHREEP